MYAEELERRVDVLKFALQTIAPSIDYQEVLEIDLSQLLEAVSQALIDSSTRNGSNLGNYNGAGKLRPFRRRNS